MYGFARITLAVAVAISATGCPADDTTTPPDGSSGGGLTIEWSSQPSVIPSEPSSDRTIERVVLRLDDLRVVGDVGTLSPDRDKLEWSRGIVPTEVPVTGASPGLYSRLLFELDGSDDNLEYAYEITGTVKVSSSYVPFTIRDTSDLNLSLDFAISLPAGGAATIPVRIDVQKIVDAVNFASVPMDDGRYLLDQTSPQISTVRAAVHDAFSIAGPS